MIGISSKIRLDVMSKIISFSISDRYLDKIRSLYPNLTENLAFKQFVTDRLDLSLDDTLDGDLDGKLKTLVESELNALLDARLDDAMGKLIGDLSERLSRVESRLDGNLDGDLDATILDSSLDDSLDAIILEDNSDKGLDNMDSPLKIGYTDQELAEKLGVTVASIKRWKTHFNKGKYSKPFTCPDFFEKWHLNEDKLWESKE